MSPSRVLPDPATEPTIKPERAAVVLDVSVRTVYAAVERGEMPAIRVGRCVRIHTARFLAAYGLPSEPAVAGLVAPPQHAPEAS